MSKRKRRPNVAHAYLGGHERERAKRVAFAFGPVAPSLLSALSSAVAVDPKVTQGQGRIIGDGAAETEKHFVSYEGRVARSLPPLFLSERPERVLFAEKIDIFHRAAADLWCASSRV